jgi:hypothetical protein
VLTLPAVTTAEARKPLFLPLKVVSVVRRGGRLTAQLEVTPGRVKSLAVERRMDDPQIQVVRTMRT